MTLKEWCDEAGVKPTHPTTETGAVSVVADALQCDPLHYTRLWRLDDYAVSSLAGVVAWLVPRRPASFTETITAAARGEPVCGRWVTYSGETGGVHERCRRKAGHDGRCAGISEFGSV